VLIKVTQEHIDKGLKTPMSNTECVLARAFKDAGFTNVCMGGSEFRLDTHSSWITMPEPLKRISEQIIEWDKGEPKPKPFTIIIRKVQ
jgi:hypothetical protein